MDKQLKERPVIFNAQEVNAVLADDKTQHRLPALTSEQIAAGYKWGYGIVRNEVIFCKYEDSDFTKENSVIVKCPFGAIGDRLWVQEDHARQRRWEEKFSLTGAHYFADGPLTIDVRHDARMLERHSASDMPRWASRILLEITNIRIERMQDITEADIEKYFVAANLIEATEVEGMRVYKIANTKRLWSECIIEALKAYWNSIHGKDAWERNYWVWVIEFVKVENDG